MANPNWKKGTVSPNPAGRGKMKHSARTVKGMVERFIKRNISPNKLQLMFDGLKTDKDKLQVLTELMPYVVAKQSSLQIESRFEEMTDADLDKLYSKVIGSITQPDPIQLPDGNTLIPANFNRYGQE